MNKKHVMVKGIDGCGKDTVLEAFTDVAHDLDLKIFDVMHHSKDRCRLPELASFKDIPVILTAEPTYAWVRKFVCT